MKTNACCLPYVVRGPRARASLNLFPGMRRWAISRLGSRGLVEDHGAASIYHTHYTGTCSAIAGDFPSRFFERLGATEVEPDTVCNMAGHVAWGYVFGDSCNGFDPRTAKDSNCILVWGANPSNSAPHVHKHWLKAHDATVVVIDPVRHETAEQADVHLQLRPGSDAALVYAMLHVMQRDGLLDTDYIRDHVLGYDDVADTIGECSPAWGEENTGIPADQIEKSRPHIRERSIHPVDGPGRSTPTLRRQHRPCAGHVASLYGQHRKARHGRLLSETGPLPWAGARAHHRPTVLTSQAAMHQHLSARWTFLICCKTLRKFGAYVSWNCNPVASNPNQALMRKGLARDDLFCVVVDCFATDTADYADYVLPAASFLEFDDVNVAYFQLMITPQVKCQEPMGDSLPNQEIFRRLAKAMGYTDANLFEADQVIIDETIAESGVAMDWEGLKQAGYTYVSVEPLIPWADGAFATPSGRMEIASQQAEADGLPRVPHPNADAPPTAGCFRLLSPADKHLMNSSYGNDARVHSLMGPATVMIHPDDAAGSGVSDGSAVRLSNEAGQIDLVAQISDAVPPRTLLSSKSRWAKCEDGQVNINVVHMARKTDMGESTSVHGTEVRLESLAVS